MTAYYNEFDPYAAQWLRNLITAGLIAHGDVDERSIKEVSADDVKGYTQCHFFAGIGGWSYALRLAGWRDDRPVWTGSCPCQPFSVAGKQAGFDDPRHLWPTWGGLIKECRPAVVFGEQVAGAVKLGWLDEVLDDLEARGYACAAATVPASGVGAPHKRDRVWFVADSAGDGREGVQRRAETQVSQDGPPETLGAWDRPGDPFADWQKLLARTEVRRLADGVSSNLAVRPSLRCFGNAIVPQVAAEVISAYMEAVTA